MFNQLDIAEVIKSEKGYIKKGNHYIHYITEEDVETFNENERIFVDVIKEENTYFDGMVTALLEEVRKSGGNNSEVNIVFSGELLDSSRHVTEQWLVKSIYHSTNNKSRLLINEKLRLVRIIVDNFLSVFKVDGKESTQCVLRYTLLMNIDKSLTNILIKPMWFHTFLSNGGDGSYSAYKIFYTIASYFENTITQPNRIIEPTFQNTKVKDDYNSSLKNLTNALKELRFTKEEIDELYECIQAILEISNFHIKGNKKSLEFIGLAHFKMAAKRLKLKEQNLHDFLIHEYVWKDNKKMLNSPENINRVILSFVSKLYEVVIAFIFDKINTCSDNPSQTCNEIKLNFFSSISLPNFNEKKLFTYGDFVQYSACSVFHDAVSSIISEKVNTFQRFCEKENTIPPVIKERSVVSMEQISNILTNFKGDQNKFENLKKAEKLFEGKIKFFKEEKIYIDIFISEYKTHVRFCWGSFLNNSDTFDIKQIRSLLKMSSLSIFRKSEINPTFCLAPNSEQIIEEFTKNVPFSIKTFIVNSLVDVYLQSGSKYSLAEQISRLALRYVFYNEICSICLPLEEFVFKYRALFLNHRDTSTDWFQSSKHAIKLLKLENAWCCENYIHLEEYHIKALDHSKNNFINNVIVVQRYLRIIIAKMKLRKLRHLSKEYQRIFSNSVERLNTLSKEFECKYYVMCKVDLENVDIDFLKDLTPSMKALAEMKENEFQWLHMFVFNGLDFVAKECFKTANVCIYKSKDGAILNSNCLDINSILPKSMDGLPLDPFIMKISQNQSEDVTLTFKSKQTFYVWNLETAVNEKMYDHLSLSRGKIYPEKEYRVFSMEYIVRKIAFCIVNQTPFNFKDLVRECSFALILIPDPICNKSLSKSPLWLYFTNYHPICNLSSHFLYEKVDKEIRNIDKKECLKFVKGPCLRPKNDWITEDVYTQLMLISLEKKGQENEYDFSDFVNTSNNMRPSIYSLSERCWSKNNYKIRKYKFKNFK